MLITVVFIINSYMFTATRLIRLSKAYYELMQECCIKMDNVSSEVHLFFFMKCFR